MRHLPHYFTEHIYDCNMLQANCKGNFSEVTGFVGTLAVNYESESATETTIKLYDIDYAFSFTKDAIDVAKLDGKEFVFSMNYPKQYVDYLGLILRQDDIIEMIYFINKVNGFYVVQTKVLVTRRSKTLCNITIDTFHFTKLSDFILIEE